MLDDILLFTELVEHKNYTKAAMHLKITQSTLSKRINNLETELKLNLIVHHTRKFELTADGEIIYQKFKHLRQYLKENINYLQNKSTLYKKSLTIGISTSFGYSTICPYIHEFIEQNQDICINIFFRHAKLEPNPSLFDIEITNYIIKQDHTECMLLGKEIAHLYCTPQYKEKYGIPTQIHELINHRFIGFMTNNPIGIPKTIIFRNKYHNYEYIYNNTAPQIKVNLPSHMKQIGINGDYIFMSWYDSCRHEIANGSIIQILTDYEAPYTEYYLTVKTDYGPTERKFIEFVKNCINRTY